MENMLYHSAVPEATQATYGEFNNVDFVLNVGPGRSLMRNSVRLNGDVKINSIIKRSRLRPARFTVKCPECRTKYHLKD